MGRGWNQVWVLITSGNPSEDPPQKKTAQTSPYNVLRIFPWDCEWVVCKPTPVSSLARITTEERLTEFLPLLWQAKLMMGVVSFIKKKFERHMSRNYLSVVIPACSKQRVLSEMSAHMNAAKYYEDCHSTSSNTSTWRSSRIPSFYCLIPQIKKPPP